jgi:stage III sporulation protein AB
MWQLKLIGCAFITVWLTMLGFKKAQKLTERCRLLENAQVFILQTSDKIRCGEGEISEILNQTMPKGMNKELLEPNEQSILEEFINGAGMGDFVAEEKRCAVYYDKITELKNQAIKEKQEKNKLYCAVGFSSGLMISLLLI